MLHAAYEMNPAFCFYQNNYDFFYQKEDIARNIVLSDDYLILKTCLKGQFTILHLNAAEVKTRFCGLGVHDG